MSTPTVKFGTAFTNRFRSADCDHQNSHITQEAALKCAGSKDAKLTTVKRYWGTKNGTRCECKFGHRTAEIAMQCVNPAPKKATKAAPKPTAKATPKPKPTPAPKPGALHSVAEGASTRA